MSDTAPNGNQSADAVGEPPEDFGASVIAEFQKRENAKIAAQAAAGASDDGAPPGGWPPQDVPATTTPATPDAGTAQGDVATPASGSATEGAASTTAEAAPAPPATDPGGESATVSAGSVVAGGQPDDAAGTGGTPAASSGYTWTLEDGKSATFTDAEVQRAIALSAWAADLPQETRDAIGSLESGQAVAIPRGDYDQFVAWKGQQSRTTRDADLANLDVEPEVAKIIGDLRDKVSALEGQPVQPQVDPAYQQRAINEMNVLSQQFNTAQEQYAQVRGLSPEEVEGLMQVAVRAEVIPTLIQQGTVFNPVTGAVVQPANIADVTAKALDWALVQNPALRTRLLTPQAAPATAPPPGAPSAIDQKKARAASLATAPSGTTAPSPVQVKQMSETERVAAMAREIENAISA